MFTQLVSFLGRSLQTRKVAPLTTKTQISENPFANPFITNSDAGSRPFYGKNRPVQGGYFAGYYNGKPNIVGTRLFVEV